MEEVKGELEDVTDALNEYQQDMERLMKRGMLLREKADSARRDSLSMGSLPSKELKEYKSIKSRSRDIMGGGGYRKAVSIIIENS